MNRALISAAALAALVIGCEKAEEKSATPATPAAPARSDVPTTVPSTPAVEAPGMMPSAEAQGKLDQVMQYIKDKKYDLAEKTLSELESNKSSLPASVQSQLPTARSVLNAAKMGGGDAGGMKMPDLRK